MKPAEEIAEKLCLWFCSAEDDSGISCSAIASNDLAHTIEIIRQVQADALRDAARIASAIASQDGWSTEGNEACDLVAQSIYWKATQLEKSNEP